MRDARRVLGVRGEQAALDLYRRRGFTLVARNWQCSLGESRILTDIAGLDIPTLYLTGTASPAPARTVASLLAPALPQGELRELDGVGHMGPLTHPDRVNAAIERFLNRHLGAQYERAA